MNWYIGQPIVAIKTHSLGIFKKGQEFIIKGLERSFCGCGHTSIDIGIVGNGIQYCNNCKKNDNKVSRQWWVDEANFAPLDINISELTKVLEREAVK